MLLFYCVFALIAEGQYIDYFWQLHLVVLLAGVVVLSSSSRRVFSPINLAIGLYALCFAISPVIVDQLNAHSDISIATFSHGDLELAAWTVLLGFVSLLGGYWVFSRHSLPALGLIRSGMRFPDRKSMDLARNFGMLFLVVGFVGYVGTVLASGGVIHMLTFDGARTYLFQDSSGTWYWASFLMVSGASALSVSSLKNNDVRRWGLWGILVVLYFAYRGKDQVVGMLVCGALFHAAVRGRFSWKAVFVFVMIILAATMAVDMFRTIESTTESWRWILSDIVSSNIEMLDAVALAVGFGTKYQIEFGVATLVSWLEPVDRLLLGDAIATILSGVELDLEVFPEHYHSTTALSPTIVGELFVAYGYTGVAAGMALYGGLMAMLERVRSRASSYPMLFAIYPFFLYMALKTQVDGTTNLFRVIVVAAPLLVVHFLVRYRQRALIFSADGRS
ncbi:MAG: oligosaccharide repeat unit polymerase [Burkholderiaceae bacterium]|nr:oligosaccharide repeat unit polymerase [Burkholderiaceae bacterium]